LARPLRLCGNTSIQLILSRASYPFGLTRHGQTASGAVKMLGDGELRQAAKRDTSKDVGEELLLSFGLLECLLVSVRS